MTFEALYPASDRESSVLQGIVVNDVVPGALGRWERSAAGDWLGVVTFIARCNRSRRRRP